MTGRELFVLFLKCLAACVCGFVTGWLIAELVRRAAHFAMRAL